MDIKTILQHTESLPALTVGDIADYEDWRKITRRKELIGITKELYGDKIPVDAVASIESEMKKIPSLMDGDGFDITAAQFLIWKSIQKIHPQATMKEVGDALDVSMLDQYAGKLFPETLAAMKTENDAEKKTARRGSPSCGR